MLFEDYDERNEQEPQPEVPQQDRPLAERVRPEGFDDILGQDKIWGTQGPLRRLAAEDRFHSLILWGPPGTGKTSLAHLIGKQGGRKLVCLSAVHAGVKEIRLALKQSLDDLGRQRKAHILFMDEVHRLNKGQQDTLLPALEAGAIKFIGATTENPSFEVNNAINSRSLIFRLTPIEPPAMVGLLQKALAHPASGFGQRQVRDDVLTAVAASAGGDARRALNLLDMVLTVNRPEDDPLTSEGLKSLHEVFPGLRYDKGGDDHFDTASALIKSIRASHPDAAIYYLARMLAGGEDPMFIARRLVIAASEDIGNANPHALSFATAGAQAVHQLGMPEARIVLAQICTLLASSPKSNRAYLAIDKALADVDAHGPLPIPLGLRNAPTAMMRQFGYSEGYAYAHSDPEAAKQMSYLPEALKGRRYYEPSDSGFEQQMRQTLARQRPHAD